MSQSPIVDKYSDPTGSSKFDEEANSEIINRILHVKTIFVLVPRNKGGHMNNLHYFEKPMNFLLVPLIVSVCLLQNFHSPYIRNYNR